MAEITLTRKLPLAILGLGLAVLLTAPTTFAAPAQCRIADASHLPAYAIQGTWTPDQSMLVLVDSVAEQIDVYDGKSGRYRGPLVAPAAVREAGFFPVGARTSGDRLVVETHSSPDRQLLYLGDRFQLESVRQPLEELRSGGPARDGAVRRKGAAAQSGPSLESMFMWSFVGKNDIVACGDIQQADGTWQTGIVRFDAEAANGFRTYAASDFHNPEWVFCRLGLPYIASIGETAYVLLMNDQPGIYRIDGKHGAVRLDYDLAVGRDSRLPEYTNEVEFVGTMTAVERQSMPTGLYAAGHRLFVLYREVGVADAGLRWFLEEVDPSSGAVNGRATIGTISPHLMLVPGQKTWALVEKGSVIQFGNQPTERIRLLSANAIGEKLKGDLCSAR